MSWSDSLHKAAHMLEVADEGIIALQKLTHVGGDKAAETLAAIDAGLAALADGFSGKTDPDVVRSDLKALVDRIAANNAEIEKEINDKFDHEG